MKHALTVKSKLSNLQDQLHSLLQITKRTSQILQIQAQLTTSNLVTDSFTSSRLLCSLTSPKTLNMDHAEAFFSQIRQPNTYMYNTMIKGYVTGSCPDIGFRFYVNMRRDGVFGDNYTYPFVLKACGAMEGLVEGRGVHGEVVKRGFASYVFVVNSLIGMYCKCREMGFARAVFDGCGGGKDVVSWNLMVGGLLGCGAVEEAQNLFDEMPEKDVISWSIMIDGYSKKLGDVACARAMFNSMPSRDLVSWNSMIQAYAKAGELVAARELFDEMQVRSVVSWSIMIDGYVCHGNPKEGLNLFRQMLCKGIVPDEVSVVGAISACTQLGALDQGRWIHAYIKKHKIKMDIVVQTALVDMYMKCGSYSEARKMFHSMSERNIVSWNVMIVGLGMHGFGEEALEYFALMEKEGYQMDHMIFLAVLTACSHSGMVSKGLQLFNEMTGIYMMEPKIEHYSCLVDLLGRAGQLDQALAVLDSMPIKAHPTLWGSLLLACQIHQNAGLAKVVANRLAKLNADDSGVYVLLSNICADAGMWKDVLNIRELVRDRDIKKEAGRSIIEVDGNVEEFVSGGKFKVQNEILDRVIQSLSKRHILAAG